MLINAGPKGKGNTTGKGIEVLGKVLALPVLGAAGWERVRKGLR